VSVSESRWSGMRCGAGWCGCAADGSDDSVSEPDIIDVMSPSIEGESYAFPEDRGTRTLLTRVTDAPAKKPYDVTYKVRTMQEIMEMQQKEVRKVQNLLEVPVGHSFFCPSVTLIINWVSSMADKRTQSSTAAILLRHYAWNAEKLQEQFWNDPARALLEAGLSPPSSPSTSTVPDIPPDLSGTPSPPPDAPAPSPQRQWQRHSHSSARSVASTTPRIRPRRRPWPWAAGTGSAGRVGRNTSMARCRVRGRARGFSVWRMGVIAS
jgi:hypothetical protein